MDHEQIIGQAELRPMSSVDLGLPALPGQGAELLARFARVHRARRVAHVACHCIGDNVELTAMRHATSSSYRHRDVAPHQIAGDIKARRFETFDASADALRSTFDDAVLLEVQDGEVYLVEPAVLTRQRMGQAVWREPGAPE